MFILWSSLSIHCILKFFDLFGFLRHYLLSAYKTTEAVLKLICKGGFVGDGWVLMYTIDIFKTEGSDKYNSLTSYRAQCVSLTIFLVTCPSISTSGFSSVHLAAWIGGSVLAEIEYLAHIIISYHLFLKDYIQSHTYVLLNHLRVPGGSSMVFGHVCNLF